MIEVFMPVFGMWAQIRQAIESVRRQSDTRWTLTVVDDAGPDPSMEDRIAAFDDCRIRYRRNDSTLGINGNFRHCLELAREPHLVIMGQDDVMWPNYIEVVMNALARFPEAAVIQPGVRVIDSTGHPVRPLVDRVKSLNAPKGKLPSLFRGEALAVTLMRGNWTYFPSMCWRRGVAQDIGFRKDLSIALDLALLMDLTMAGHAILVLPEHAFSYRRHSASASSSEARTGLRFAEERDLYQSLAVELDEIGWRRAARAARIHVTSRLHALTGLPSSLARRDLSAARQLSHHIWS